MPTNPTHQGIAFLIGEIRKTPDSRYTEGVRIATQAPQSALYLKFSDLKLSADDLVAKNTGLKAASDKYHASLAAAEAARTELDSAALTWDVFLDAFLSSAAKHVQTPEDAASLALTIRERARNLLAMPLGVLVKYNAQRDWIRIHVERAPGMTIVSVEVSTDLTNPAGWKELDGHGAVQFIKSPAPGTYWVRAASRTAQEKSEFTTPVSVIVK